jgi:putative transposase
MKASRFTEEQIIGILREQETGAATADVCRRHGISSATFYKWKLEDENAKQEASGGSDARQRHAQGCRLKKMVTPAVRREAIAHLRTSFEVSERRACSALGVDARRYAIGVAGRTMTRYGRGCVNWPRCAAGSAIADCMC